MTDESSADAPRLVAHAIVEILNRHRVDYVVVGAFAALAQRALIPPTRDIDITPDTSRANLERLSAALTELRARVRTTSQPEGIPFAHEGSSLRDAVVWNLICRYGEFDLTLQPAGFERGFADLRPRAHEVSIEGVVVIVADLADVIRSKEAAGRPKDLRVLPTLYQRLAELQAGVE